MTARRSKGGNSSAVAAVPGTPLVIRVAGTKDMAAEAAAVGAGQSAGVATMTVNDAISAV